MKKPTHAHAGRIYQLGDGLWLDWCNTCGQLILKRAKPGGDDREWDQRVLDPGDPIDSEGQKGLGL